MSFSHHESPEESEIKSRLLDQFLNRARPDFPDGPISRTDEGQLAFAIAADKTQQVVLIHFGKRVAWVGMSKKEALQLAQLLTDRAAELT